MGEAKPWYFSPKAGSFKVDISQIPSVIKIFLKEKQLLGKIYELTLRDRSRSDYPHFLLHFPSGP